MVEGGDTPAYEALRRAIESSPDGGLDLGDPDNLFLFEAVQQEGDAYIDARRSEAREQGNWEDYLRLFGSHEARDALIEVAGEIEPADVYWRCIASVWTGDDAPGLAEEDWRCLFNDVYGAYARAAIMTGDERAALTALPDPVRVFRGFARPNGERGFAWTLEREKAEWFACNYHDGPRLRMLYGVGSSGGDPQVAVGSVAKSDVIAHFLERKEAEIVALPENVAILAIEKAQPQEDED